MPDQPLSQYGGFNPDQAEQPADPEQTLSEESDYFSPMGSFGGGGLDRLRSTTERQISKLAQQRPVYEFGGQVGFEPPPVANVRYIGEPMETPAPESVQSREIKRLQGKIPLGPDGRPLSNMWVWEKRNEIYQGLVQGNAGKPIDMDSFIHNSYWDKFKNVDPDTRYAFMDAAFNAVKPIAKQHQVLDSLNQEWTSALKDDVQNHLLSQLNPIAQTTIQSVLSGRNNNVGFAQKELMKIQEKAQVLANPDYMKVYKDIQSNPDLSDYKTALQLTTGPTRFESILRGIMDKQTKLNEHRDALSNDVEVALGTLPGEMKEVVISELQNAARGGVFDTDKPALTGLLRRLRDEPGQLETLPNGQKLYMVSLDLLDKGQKRTFKIPSLFQADLESKFNKELEKYKDKPGSYFLTKDNKIIESEEVPAYAIKEAKIKFPRSGFDEDGEWVYLPRQNIFQNANDQKVYPKIPGRMTEEEPDTVLVGPGMYVRREVLKKMGVQMEDLINVSRSEKEDKYMPFIKFPTKEKQAWLIKDTPTYEPPLMSLEKYQEGKPGEKFENEKGYFEAVRKYNEELIAGKTKTGIPLSQYIAKLRLEDGATAQAGWGEVLGKMMIGFPGRLVIQTTMNVPEQVMEFGNFTVAGIHDLFGDTEGANKYYQASTGGGGLPSWSNLSNVDADEALTDAIDNGNWMNMKGVMGTPQNMSTAQAITYHGLGMIAELVTAAYMGKMGTKMAGAAMGESPFLKFIHKLSTSEDDIKSLQVLGRTAEMIKAQNAMIATDRTVMNVLNFMSLAALGGRGEEIPLSGVQGAVAGWIPPIAGSRGLFGKSMLVDEAGQVTEKALPWLPNLRGVANGLFQATGMNVVDVMSQLHEGKSQEEMKAMYKTPEYWSNIAMMTIMGMHHQQHYSALERKLSTPIPVKPLTPVIDLFKKPGASLPDQQKFADELPNTIRDMHPTQVNSAVDKVIELSNKGKLVPFEEKLLKTLVDKLTVSNPYASKKAMAEHFVFLMNKNETQGLTRSEILMAQRLNLNLKLKVKDGFKFRETLPTIPEYMTRPSADDERFISTQTLLDGVPEEKRGKLLGLVHGLTEEPTRGELSQAQKDSDLARALAISAKAKEEGRRDPIFTALHSAIAEAQTKGTYDHLHNILGDRELPEVLTPLSVPTKPEKSILPTKTPPEKKAIVREFSPYALQIIRDANAKTTRQIQALDPKLSREQAAELRRQAWGEKVEEKVEIKPEEVEQGELLGPTAEEVELARKQNSVAIAKEIVSKAREEAKKDPIFKKLNEALVSAETKKIYTHLDNILNGETVKVVTDLEKATSKIEKGVKLEPLTHDELVSKVDDLLFGKKNEKGQSYVYFQDPNAPGKGGITITKKKDGNWAVAVKMTNGKATIILPGDIPENQVRLSVNEVLERRAKETEKKTQEEISGGESTEQQIQEKYVNELLELFEKDPTAPDAVDKIANRIQKLSKDPNVGMDTAVEIASTVKYNMADKYGLELRSKLKDHGIFCEVK